MTIITEISLYGYQITTCLLQKRSDEKRKCPILWQFIAIIFLRPLFREIIICTSAEIIILKKIPYFRDSYIIPTCPYRD